VLAHRGSTEVVAIPRRWYHWVPPQGTRLCTSGNSPGGRLSIYLCMGYYTISWNFVMDVNGFIRVVDKSYRIHTGNGI